MGFIDANGIYKYDSSDSLTPLETLLNLGEQSVSDKFAQIGPGTIRYVANTSARNSLASSYSPTATKPLYVYRGDATTGRNIEFTLNGSDWNVISDSRYMPDVAWSPVPSFSAGAGWTNVSAYYQVKSGWVYLYVSAAASATHTLNVGTGTISDPTLCIITTTSILPEQNIGYGLSGGNTRLASGFIVGKPGGETAGFVNVGSVSGSANFASGNAARLYGSYPLG